MSNNLTEIRWHGRGGQGAKTAALLFGEASLGEGKYIQAFPEYGPERMGAPVQAFNRISNQPIFLHCRIENPDIVIVLDVSLITKANVINGLKENGILIINTKELPTKIREQINIKKYKIYTVDANTISKETIGREIPNTPMMGALVKVSKLIKLETMLSETKKRLEKKFRLKPEMIESNIKAIKRAYEEVKTE